jgi:enterochelin esterase-like enzyme
LALLNRGLNQEPYQGLIVACPYTPDILRGDDPFPKAEPMARFVTEQLLPRLYQETPALGAPGATGIDGVSLGGRTAISVGLLRPLAFGAVSSLQAAFDPENAGRIAFRAKKALGENPALKLRLLTSSADFFLPAHRVISQALRAAQVPHELVVVPGRHDYDFNRGPGAYEMLIYHDRVLRGKRPL